MNNKEKILLIFNGYSTNKKGKSGGETRAVCLIDYLVKKKFDVSVCLPQKYHLIKPANGLKLLTYSSLPYEEKLYENLFILFFIYCYRIIISIFKIRKVKADIIISSSHLFHDVIPLFFVGNKDCTFVTYIHHIISKQKRRGVSSSITSFLERISFYIIKKINSIVFTDSEINKISLINEYGFEKKYVHVIKNGISLDFINKVVVVNPPIYDICFCGRLDKTKGIYDLTNIIKIVKNFYPNILCAIIGVGREKINLEKAIANDNLKSNIKLMGFLDEEEKIVTMKMSKLFVLPSHEEGWGIVIGEALACGTPTIVYELKDIVGIWGDTVTWVECFDVIKFSDAIIRLLKNGEERGLFIQKGKEFAKTIDWKDILQDELSVILKDRS